MSDGLKTLSTDGNFLRNYGGVGVKIKQPGPTEDPRAPNPVSGFFDTASEELAGALKRTFGYD